jgi:hypothetical protein
MTLNIPLSPEKEAKLRARADALGTDPTHFVLEALEEKLAKADGNGGASPDARIAAWNRFVAGMRNWTQTLPADHRMDDTREAIYEGRGE